MGDATSFVGSCDILPDGFVGRHGAAWRFGSVLLLRHGDAIALVRKSAADPAYRFGNDWALPGGMARLTHSNDLKEDRPDVRSVLSHSIAARAQAEAGIALEACEGGDLSDAFGPIVTSYEAKGAERFTLVGVHHAKVSRALDLEVTDSSVSAARWHATPLPWRELAPANRVLIGHALWADLSEREREAARAAIADALTQCRAWGAAMGWDRLPAPWAEKAEIMAWRQSWSD